MTFLKNGKRKLKKCLKGRMNMIKRASDQIDLTKVVDGKDGTSVTILGSYNTMAELEAAHPTGSRGDAYMVGGDLVIWNGTSWENVGRIQGPQGTPGTPGAPGTGVASVQPQYYLSTSDQSATGGTWGNTITFVSGLYIWSRDEITYSNGSVGHSAEVYNQALTIACENAISALAAAQAVNQYTWHTETDTGAGAGTHITAIPKDEFLADPDNSGYNSLFDNIGMKVRNGLRILARFGASMVIGEDDGARVEVDSNTVRGITEDGVEAFSIESSAQDAPQEVTKVLTNEIAKNATQTVTLSDLTDGVNATTISLSYTYRYWYRGIAEGFYKSTSGTLDFVKGTASLYSRTYTENATGTSVTRTFTIAYDGANSFTITNPSPHFTFGLTKIKFTSQSAPRPETNFNGLFFLNGINLEQPTLDTTTLTPYSNRCDIIDGGIFRFGKWRFIQINVQISDISLGANNTWAILKGLSNDLPLTNGRDTSNNLVKMANLSASAQRNAGDISAYINGNGRIVVATSDNALTVGDVVMISGFYIAE